MKIIFVSSGILKDQPSPIIKSQGESLLKNGIALDFFTINKKGIKGYFIEFFRLKRILKNNEYNIIHAHYGLSAIVCLFAKKKEKLIVSFMGDDILGTNKPNGKTTLQSKLLIKINIFLAKKVYDKSIVKTKEMHNALGIKEAIILPNGVNTEIFKIKEKSEARKKIGIHENDKLVIFVSNPQRPEKNFKLAKSSVSNLKELKLNLLPLFNINHEKLANYYNAADLLIMTSFHEGSPNVIKEAMACSCPIVTTDVGDVKWILKNVEGCYVSSYDSKLFSEDISRAFYFSQLHNRTLGRERIFQLGLDSDTIANKLISLYYKL